jgi:prepilin-type N-terminal cleavage/methylation domain-containing protein
MTKNNLKSKEGFTIIEVVLVLAIAGLIFLMVFIAFPGLQRSQKDTQRRNDLANLATRIIDYQTNNRNQIPDTSTGSTAWDAFKKQYFSEYEDPDGNAYKIVPQGPLADGTDTTATTDSLTWENNLKTDTDNTKYHQILVWNHAHCDGEKAVYDASPRKVAFLYILEAGNIYCGNN